MLDEKCVKYLVRKPKKTTRRTRKQVDDNIKKNLNGV
jgi:hypothetical protein